MKITFCGRILALATVCILLAVSAYASDECNLCIFNQNPESANISLPADDAFHYPDQWTGDRKKTNRSNLFGGVESDYKVWHWTAIPRDGGEPVRIDGFQSFAALRIGGIWTRVLMAIILGPDKVYHQYYYLAPGKFTPCENCYDIQLGANNEPFILEIEEGPSFVRLDPSVLICRTVGSGGTNMASDFVSTDGNIEFHTKEESLKRANYPANDGYDPFLRYYWARSYLASWGTLTYFGTTYDVYGSAWIDREWQFNKTALQKKQRWYWTAIQIKGCLDDDGNKIPCHLATTTINAWDNFYNAQEEEYPQHYWSEVGPPPFCRDFSLTEKEEWGIEPLAFWTSPRNGIQYATKVRLTAPSRGADLTITAIIDDQEVWKAGAIMQGLWEGGAYVEGTLEGKRVWGDAMLEQYRAPIPEETTE